MFTRCGLLIAHEPSSHEFRNKGIISSTVIVTLLFHNSTSNSGYLYYTNITVMHSDTIQVHLSNTVITYDAHPLYYEVERHDITLCQDQKSECMI